LGGAGDVEQSVGDTAQRASPRVPAYSQGVVFGAARPIMLDGDPGPIVERVARAVIAGRAPN